MDLFLFIFEGKGNQHVGGRMVNILSKFKMLSAFFSLHVHHINAQCNFFLDNIRNGMQDLKQNVLFQLNVQQQHIKLLVQRKYNNYYLFPVDLNAMLTYIPQIFCVNHSLVFTHSITRLKDNKHISWHQKILNDLS